MQPSSSCPKFGVRPPHLWMGVWICRLRRAQGCPCASQGGHTLGNAKTSRRPRGEPGTGFQQDLGISPRAPDSSGKHPGGKVAMVRVSWKPPQYEVPPPHPFYVIALVLLLAELAFILKG